MKLIANVITNGRYYKAGDEVPDDLISDAMRKYAVTVSEDGDAVDASYAGEIQRQRSDADDLDKPKVKAKAFTSKGKSFVKRGDRYVLSSAVENLMLAKSYTGSVHEVLALMKGGSPIHALEAKPTRYEE